MELELAVHQVTEDGLDLHQNFLVCVLPTGVRGGGEGLTLLHLSETGTRITHQLHSESEHPQSATTNNTRIKHHQERHCSREKKKSTSSIPIRLDKVNSRYQIFRYVTQGLIHVFKHSDTISTQGLIHGIKYSDISRQGLITFFGLLIGRCGLLVGRGHLAGCNGDDYS